MYILLHVLFQCVLSVEIHYPKNNIILNTDNENQYVDLANWLSHIEIFTEYMEIVIGVKAQMSNVTLHDIVIDDLKLEKYEDVNYKGVAVDITIAQVNISMEKLNIGIIGSYDDQYMCINGLSLHIIIDLQTDETNCISSFSIPTKVIKIKCSSVDSSNNLLKASKIFIPNVFKKMLDESLNPMLQNIVAQLNQSVQQFATNNDGSNLFSTNAFDLRKSSVVDAISFFLNKFLAPETGKLSINSLFDRFTENTNVFNLYKILESFGINQKISSVSNVNDVGDFSFVLNSLTLSGLNTFSDFNFLSPKDGFTFDNIISIDDIEINISFDFTILLNGQTANSNGYSLKQSNTVELILDNTSASCQIQAVSPIGAGKDYTNSQCLNMDCIGSLFTNETKVNSIGINLNLSTFNVENEPFDQPNDETETEKLETKVYTFAVNLIQIILKEYYDTIMLYLKAFSIPAINDNFYTSLSNISCQYIPNDEYHDFTLWTTLTAIGVSIGLTLIICLLMFCPAIVRKKNQNSEGELDSTKTESEKDTENVESSEITIKKVGFFAYFFRNDDKSSLLMNKALSFWVRILFPLLIFLNIALFVSSNTGIGASVFIKFTVSPEKIVNMPSMFDFGLVSTIKNMWKAGSYGLSIIVALFSCVWPYAKLIMMLLIWIFPVCIIKKNVRETLLKVLDALGKWSLADSFVMVLMLIAYHLDISLPIQFGENNQPFVINLWVYPGYGFITLCIGTIFSLALSHIMLAVVRHCDKVLEEKNEKSKNCIALFKFCHNEFLKYFVIFVILCTFVTLICGIIFNTFSFEFVGLIGWAINLLDYDNRHEYSVINLAFDLPPSCENPNSFTVRFTQALFFLVSILLPILHVILLFTMWVIPLTKRIQIGFFKACEILYAWSCLDVFMVSVLLTIAEISQFSIFMVGDRCDAINPIIEKYFGNEDIIEGHETCFDVITVLQKGSWLLIVAAVMHNVATIIVNVVSRKALSKRDETDTFNDEFQSKNEISDDSACESQYL